MIGTKVFTADDLLTMPGDYELIKGELREVKLTTAEASTIAMEIGSALYAYVRSQRMGAVTGADGGFVLFADRLTVVAPDAAFIRRESIPPDFDFLHFFPVPPDLALEAVSPSDTFIEVMEKVDLYLEAGVRLVWVAIPKRRVVMVFRPGKAPQTLAENDDLDGEDVIPGFRMSVRDVFADTLAE